MPNHFITYLKALNQNYKLFKKKYSTFVPGQSLAGSEEYKSYKGLVNSIEQIENLAADSANSNAVNTAILTRILNDFPDNTVINNETLLAYDLDAITSFAKLASEVIFANDDNFDLTNTPSEAVLNGLKLMNNSIFANAAAEILDETGEIHAAILKILKFDMLWENKSPEETTVIKTTIKKALIIAYATQIILFPALDFLIQDKEFQAEYFSKKVNHAELMQATHNKIVTEVKSDNKGEAILAIITKAIDVAPLTKVNYGFIQRNFASKDTDTNEQIRAAARNDFNKDFPEIFNITIDTKTSINSIDEMSERLVTTYNNALSINNLNKKDYFSKLTIPAGAYDLQADLNALVAEALIFEFNILLEHVKGYLFQRAGGLMNEELNLHGYLDTTINVLTFRNHLNNLTAAIAHAETEFATIQTNIQSVNSLINMKEKTAALSLNLFQTKLQKKLNLIKEYVADAEQALQKLTSAMTEDEFTESTKLCNDNIEAATKQISLLSAAFAKIQISMQPFLESKANALPIMQKIAEQFAILLDHREFWGRRLKYSLTGGTENTFTDGEKGLMPDKAQQMHMAYFAPHNRHLAVDFHLSLTLAAFAEQKQRQSSSLLSFSFLKNRTVSAKTQVFNNLILAFIEIWKKDFYNAKELQTIHDNIHAYMSEHNAKYKFLKNNTVETANNHIARTHK